MPKGISSLITEDTLPKLLLRDYQRYGDKKIAMRRKDLGIWNSYTWKDSYETTKWLSLGLVSLGLEPGDKVSILGENDPEWYWAELAAQAAGGVAVGIFTDCIPSEVKYIVEHSDSKFVFAHDQEQCDKLLEIKDELPLLKKVIYWDPKGLWFYEEPILMYFYDLVEMGKKYEETHPDVFEKNVERGKWDDTACLCYTSGTTGAPKGAMLSYRSIIESSCGWMSASQMYETDEYLSYLPPAWAAEQYLGIAGGLICVPVINFPEEPETVQDNVREIGPQLILYSSRLWENLNSLVQAKIADTGFIRGLLYRWFLRLGSKVANLRMANKEPNLFLKAIYVLGEAMVFRPLRDKLGLMKIRSAFSSGTAISPDMIMFFRAIGVNLKQTYGITETGILATHRDDDIKPESTGPPHPGFEIRVSPEGELLVKSLALFEGYYKNPEATAKAMENGWYISGDAGNIGDDGHVIVFDRMSELMTLADGSKFAPQYIETRLRFSPYIKEAIAIGREYVSAIINIDFDNVGKWAEDHHIGYTTFVDLSQKEEVADLVSQDIYRLNMTLPEHAKIRRYILLHKEFDPDEAEMTRTRKLRRTFVEDRYRDLIQAVYNDQPEYRIETAVKYRDGRVGTTATSLKIRTLQSAGDR